MHEWVRNGLNTWQTRCNFVERTCQRSLNHEMSVYPNNYVVSLVNAQWTHLLQLDQEKELGAFFVFFIHKASKFSWPTTKFSTKIKLKTMQIYMQIAKFCKIFILLCKVFKGAQSWPGWPYLNMWKREMPNMRNCQSPILISELESISDCDQCSASEIQFTLFEMVIGELNIIPAPLEKFTWHD